MTPVIQLKKVTKLYGKNVGVKNVSLDIKPGSIFGFLGPNGSGKTTTISMLVDLIRPSKGSINIFGLDSKQESVAIRRRIGFLSGDFALDETLTGLQQLKYFANLRGGVPITRIRELAKQFECNLNRPIKTLSRGNRQKVGLISALMHDPELLIFDEPTSGLDPLMQAEFNKILLEHKQKGKTAFISSHVLSEVQEVCDEVAFIREGSVIAIRHTSELGAKLPKRVRISRPDTGLKSKLKELDSVTLLKGDDLAIEFSYGGDINQLIGLLSKNKLQDLIIEEADLETIFMKYYEDSDV